MKWRDAGPDDQDAITDFLREHIQSSMFPLSNLSGYGMRGDAPYATRFWVAEDERFRNVVGLTNSGMLMPQVPDISPGQLATLKSQLAKNLLFGVSGEATQVRQCLQAWGLNDARTRHDADEPGYALELDDLLCPDVPGAILEPPNQENQAQFVKWRTGTHRELFGETETDALKMAKKDMAAYTQRGTHRMLRVDGAPVAMTGINASFEDVVQIGGVYTEPLHRGKGYARLAVALHLLELRQLGIRRAVLFAASEMAARAYRGIGFQRAGSMALVLFRDRPEIQT